MNGFGVQISPPGTVSGPSKSDSDRSIMVKISPKQLIIGGASLMIGAAKHLTSGSAIGIDIWNNEDLSGNNAARTLQNARLEGVKDKVELLNENIVRTTFASKSFQRPLKYLSIFLSNIFQLSLRKREREF